MNRDGKPRVIKIAELPYNEVVWLFLLSDREGAMCTKDQFKAEGKRAFHPDKDPLALNPYPHASIVSAYDIWLEGWREAAIKHEQKASCSYRHVLTSARP